MKKILKGAGVLLILTVMVFSSIAVIAETTNKPMSELGEQSRSNLPIKNDPPYPGQAIIWNNGDPDFVNGLSCTRVGIPGLSELADDFHTDKDYIIKQLVWETVDDTSYLWDSFGDVIIYQYTPYGPGFEIVNLSHVENSREYLGEQFSRPWYRYTIDLAAQGEQFILTAGDYYILLRPYSAGTDGQSFWLTSPAPPGNTSECYFRSTFFGFPDWTEATSCWGAAYDVNFKIIGDVKNKEINKPIMNFFQNHPNLFPILRYLLGL
ncbi:hypothetical protein AYK24_01540 [Thermoplasmatales archaeon SG8-52-4]|nr:MAG: hypothetical protein AYK24_01540 [Thermoplasmatales archaeon SG8-52-4]